ncbi:hypothetical protein ACRRTK_022111 [Alexandromys fortis]
MEGCLTPSLAATGWRVKWGPQCCTCNFTYFSLVSAQKSKKNIGLICDSALTTSSLPKH